MLDAGPPGVGKEPLAAVQDLMSKVYMPLLKAMNKGWELISSSEFDNIRRKIFDSLNSFILALSGELKLITFICFPVGQLELFILETELP